MASADKSRRLRKRAKRSQAYKHLCEIAAHCEQFLESRGTPSEGTKFQPETET